MPDTPSILIFGGAGQIGQALAHETKPSNWEWIAPSRNLCDITDHRAVQKIIHERPPALVINSAAMTAVDACETQPERANAINFDAVANLAAQCSARDVPLVQLSTDYVFDGTNHTPYQPTDPMNPINVYGHSKMMGEEAIRAELPWHVILRVSSVFSAYGSNLLTKSLKLIDERDELKVVTDQIASPTAAPEIAKAIITIATAILKGKSNGFGTFHLCGTPATTRFTFMEDIIDAYAPAKRPRLIPAVSSDFPGFAARPLYAVMDCTTLAATYGIQQKPWRDGLTEAIKTLTK